MRAATRAFLRVTLTTLNAALLLLGLATALVSLYVLLKFEKRRREDADAVAPRSPPAPWPPPGAASPAPPSPPPGAASPSPWFLYLLIGAGCYVVCAAGLGLCGADRANRCCLRLHAHVTALALLAQAALLAACVLDARRLVAAPPDATGASAEAWALVERDLPLARGLLLAVVLAQVFAAACAFALAERRSAEEEEDAEDGDASRGGAAAYSDSDDEYYERHYGGRRGAPSPAGKTPGGDAHLSRALLPRRDEEAGEGEAAGEGSSSSRGAGRGRRRQDEWSVRMREKYGLDTSAFGYDPERPERGDGAGGREARRRERAERERDGEGTCVVS